MRRPRLYVAAVRIAITGASGFIGRTLVDHLAAADHDVITIGRSNASDVVWNPPEGKLPAERLDGVEAVVNLAGEPIGGGRWTTQRKAAIHDSRVASTTLLSTTLAALPQPPQLLLSGSAIGFYGNSGDTEVDETSPRGHDFLADVVVDWEAAAAPAHAAGIAVAFLRTGIVLSPNGGTLKQMLLPFRLGLGGRSGPGTQWMSWISLRDECRAIEYLLTAGVSGPVNLVAPHPATNAEFATALGTALHRPTTLVPMAGPRLLFGREMADTLLLNSNRVSPSVLSHEGFVWEDEDLLPTLQSMT